MPPKPKSKKEEALAFLDDLDNFSPDPLPPAPAPTSSTTTTSTPSSQPLTSSTSTPRVSSSHDRPLPPLSSALKSDLPSDAHIPSRSATPTLPVGVGGATEDPAEALAFLEAQLAQKRHPRVSTPLSGPSVVPSSSVVLQAPTAPRTPEPAATPKPSGGGWGSSFWSVASGALQQAKSVADETYRVAKEQTEAAAAAAQAAAAQAEGGEGVRGMVGNMGGIAGGLAGRVGDLRGVVEKGLGNRVDLSQIRQNLLTLSTDLLNTVAPPISEHEVLQVWLAHEMKGYEGVGGVVERGVELIMEQTNSSELEVIFSSSTPPKPAPAADSEPAQNQPSIAASKSPMLDASQQIFASAASLASEFLEQPPQEEVERSINPVDGWDEGAKKCKEGMEALIERVRGDERRGRPNPNLPVTTIPIYLYIQPVLVTLPFAEEKSIPAPTISESQSRSLASKPVETASSVPPKHLAFIFALVDPTHSLKFQTLSQFTPADWLEVEYERSDWVEERLVGTLRNGIENLVQEYVATRMGLKKLPPKDKETPSLQTAEPHSGSSNTSMDETTGRPSTSSIKSEEQKAAAA